MNPHTETDAAAAWDSERRDSAYSTVADPEDTYCDACGDAHTCSDCTETGETERSTTMTADFTTAPKIRHEIIDRSTGETVGEAPGIDERDALETFNRDAIENAGGQLERGMTGDWWLRFEGEAFEAKAVLATDDHRYDQDAIDNLDDFRLEQHLDARREQLARAKHDMDRCHATLERLEDPDSRTYIDTLANLGSYTREHAIQKRIIRQLETEQAKREAGRRRGDDADARLPQIDLIDEAIRARGLPLGVEDAEDTDLASAIWSRATMALETESDDGQPTNVKVAERVADTYATLYGIR